MSDKAPRVPHRERPRPKPPVHEDSSSESPTEAIPVVRPEPSQKTDKPEKKPAPERQPKESKEQRQKKLQAADRTRRLRERLALEGSIKDPGEHVPSAPEAAQPGPARPTPARALSSRVIILSLILIVSGFTLFPATTTYVRQQSDMHKAHAQLQEAKAKEQRLTDENKRLKDPEYLRQQARERIGLAMPGEKQYVVKGQPGKPENATQPVKPGEYRQGLPWGDGLWDSVMRASKP